MPSGRDFLFTITDKEGNFVRNMTTPCASLMPNCELNERHCVVVFDDFGSRDGYLPSKLTIINNSGGAWSLVGPEGL